MKEAFAREFKGEETVMKTEKKKRKVMMCGSDLNHVKGGMVSVSRNYLDAGEWKQTEVFYIATHREGCLPLKLWIFVLAYIRIFRLVLKNQVDVALLNVSERGSCYRKEAIMHLCHRFSIPVILHHHGAEFNDFYRGLPKRKQRQISKALAEADLNIVLSRNRQKDILEKAPDARVNFLYNSVRVKKENQYHSGRRLLVTFGRLGERKGTYDILKALKELDPILPQDIKAALCGDGEVEPIKALVKEYGLGKRIVHVGWVTGKKKETYMEQAMIHILPSYQEVLPMSILETMAAGIPNISTRIASIPEVIRDGENGFLMEPGDIETLKKQILLLSMEPELRMELSGAAYKTIETQFSLEHHIECLEEIFENLYKNRRGGCYGSV